MFKTIQNIHFVGIGGAGMSGIAEVLLNLGYKVTGSDLKCTEVTERLERLGAKIFYKHSAQNAGKAQVVVISTAVPDKNPEVIFAKKNKIPVIPRIEMLAELARLKYTIAIAGTHGKTTTTSMIASILQEAGLDPSFVVGGKLNHLQSGAKLGEGDFLVAEADESDGSFLKLSPTFAVITNIDNDHLDFYKSMTALRQAFVQFANRVPFYGCAIVCSDDSNVRSLFPSFNRKVVTYGISHSADYMAKNISFHPAFTEFHLLFQNKELGKIKLQISGKHNVLNALAACVCGLELQIPLEKIISALEKFENVARRLEIRGEKNGALWVDDYGHHPTEIKAVFSALKEKFPEKKIVVLFQPHRYTRTKILLKEFAKSFNGADKLFLLPIYPAGEKPIPGISSQKLLPLLNKNGVNADCVNGRKIELLEKHLSPETLFLTLGAGDVWKIGEKLFRT